MKRLTSAAALKPSPNRSASAKPHDPWGKEHPVRLSNGLELPFTAEECGMDVNEVPPPADGRWPALGLFELHLEQQCRQLAVKAMAPEERTPLPATHADPHRPPSQTRASAPLAGRSKPYAMPALGPGFSLANSPFPLNAILAQHRLERQVNWPPTLDFLLKQVGFDGMVDHMTKVDEPHSKHLAGLLLDLAHELRQKAEELARNRGHSLLSDLYRHASWHVVFLRLFIPLTLGQADTLKALVPKDSLPAFKPWESPLLNRYDNANWTPITALVVTRADDLRRTNPDLYPSSKPPQHRPA